MTKSSVFLLCLAMVFTACAFGTEPEVKTPSLTPVSSATVQPSVASSTPLPTHTVTAPPTSLTFPPSPLPTATLNPALMVAQPFIYFTFPTTTTLQIWQMTTDGSKAAVLYELPRKQTVAEVMQDNRFSAEAFQRFQETFKVFQETYKIFQDEIGYGPSEASLNLEIQSLTLSPSKMFLAWDEVYTFCPGNYCIGQDRLVILRIQDKHITFIASTPDVFHRLSWSPDSRYLVFHEGARSRLDPYPKQWLLTVSSGHQQQLGAGKRASWSPDSRHLAAIVLDDSFAPETTHLEIIDIPSGQAHRVPLRPQDPAEIFVDPAWSPDGQQLALVGNQTQPEEQPIWPLFLLSVPVFDEPKLTLLTNTALFSEPFWSPNGQWILVITSVPGNFDSGYLILNARTGETLEKLEAILPRQGSTFFYQWSDDGQAFLAVTYPVKMDTLGGRIAIVGVPNGEISTLELPAPLRQYEESSSFLKIPQLFPTW